MERFPIQDSWVVFDLGEVLSQAPPHLGVLAGMLGVDPLVSAGSYWAHSAVTGVQLTGAAQQKAIQTVADLYRNGDALDTGTDGSQALTAFVAGKVAMMFNSSGAAGQITKTAPFGWEALPYPVTGNRDTSGPIIGGAAIWVSGNSHSPAEQVASWQLVSFLANPSSQATFSTATGYVAINRPAPPAPRGARHRYPPLSASAGTRA